MLPLCCNDFKAPNSQAKTGSLPTQKPLDLAYSSMGGAFSRPLNVLILNPIRDLTLGNFITFIGERSIYMYILFRGYLRKIFQIFNLGLIKNKDLNNLQSIYIEHTSLVNKLNFFIELRDKLSMNSENSNIEYLKDSRLLIESKSETGQDFFALSASNFKQGGTFIEFGAYDGINFSNTYLLEKKFDWSGVLIDPIPSHFESIKRNRNSKSIQAAITSDKQNFVNILELPASNLSKLTERRSIFNKIHKVKAFTLAEVLDKYFPEKKLDFLSIDTEGNDLDILESLDLNNYEINAICVEHNNRIGSKKIINHMIKNGYDLAWSKYSKNDYWFIRRN